MPVRKFRSVEEMEDVWYEPGSPELMAAIRAAWDLAHRTLQPRFPPGVYKHRSIEDAQKLSDEWDRANFERYQRASGGVVFVRDSGGLRVQPQPE